MTIAIGFAARPPEGSAKRGNVWVMSDSRLTFDPTRVLDSFIKAMSLGPRSAAVAAGHSTPFMVAVEASRPFIEVNHRFRIANGLRPISIWMEARLVWKHLEMVFNQFVEAVPQASVAIVIAGWFSDGTPGLVQLTRRLDFRQIVIHRPRPEERLSVVVGAQKYVPIIEEAIRISNPEIGGQSFHDVASVLWQIIKHDGIPAYPVGGGLALGFHNGDGALFEWPFVEIDGQAFHRGLKYPNHNDWPWPDPLKLNYNPDLFDRLSRANEAMPLRTVDSPSRISVEGGDSELGLPRTWEDDWLLAIFENAQMK